MNDREAVLAERDSALAEVARREADLDELQATSPLLQAKSALLVAATERLRHARDALAALDRPARKRRAPSEESSSSESSSGSGTADDSRGPCNSRECDGHIYWIRYDTTQEGEHVCDTCNVDFHDVGHYCGCEDNELYCDFCDEYYCSHSVGEYRHDDCANDDDGD